MPAPTAQKDPNYVNKGIKLIIHYARMPQHYKNLYIQATMYIGKQIITLSDATQANWITKEIAQDEVFEVEENASIEVSREGIQIKKRNSQNNSQIARAHFIFPSNEMHVWNENFYNLAWQTQLSDRVLLLI